MGMTRSSSAGSSRPPSTSPSTSRKELGSKAQVAAVTGTLPPAERQDRIAELTGEPGRHVLVATDCLSEGVNLQEDFQAVVHYDLAWNPTRQEQREGRVDRFGQRRTSSVPSPFTARTTASTASSSTCCSASTLPSPGGPASPFPFRTATTA